jgi:CubicO group peptidase (beta-lactamase class C family)
MIRTSVGALALLTAVSLATPVNAQSAQEQLNARYDRALAAGYKALMLCGAIANAERVGEDRTPEHVTEMELTGIYPQLEQIVRELPHEIARNASGVIEQVSVQWSDDMPPRIAHYRGRDGCAILPIGHGHTSQGHDYPAYRDALVRNWHVKVSTPVRKELNAALSGEYGEGSRTTGVIVDQRGQVVDGLFAQGYGPFVPQRTWSVAKSIAATLVGMAVYRGDANVSDSAGLGADDSDPRRAITVDHLLRMASGRYSDTPGNRTDPLYFGGTTVTERAANWPLLNPPGSSFRYANNDTLMAVAAVADGFGQHSVFNQLWSIGMVNTTAEADWQGSHVLSSQVWASAFDLVEFGRLYLRGGVLPDGERVLPEGWVEYVSAPSGPQPDGPLGYGASWWLMNKSEGIPPDTIAAMGNRGQYVVVVPSGDVVIVRRGEDPAGSRFDIVSFTRDVLESLEK